MIDPQSQAILQDVIARESRSLLSYMGDAYPWATVAETETAAHLNKVVKEEREAVTALGRFLLRHRVTPPPLRSYPSGFTACNFLALDFVLKRLLETEKHALAALQADIAKITDPEARTQVQKLLALKEKTRQFLQRSLNPEPAGSS